MDYGIYISLRVDLLHPRISRTHPFDPFDKCVTMQRTLDKFEYR